MTAVAAPPRLVVMGPSGAGKSLVGAALAERLRHAFPGIAFIDADDLHPAANVEKMRAGVPLVDDDRWPWLRLVGEALEPLADDEAGARIENVGSVDEVVTRAIAGLRTGW